MIEVPLEQSNVEEVRLTVKTQELTDPVSEENQASAYGS